MALRINTNIAALNAHKSMTQTDRVLSQSLGRLSSGLRINKAADDASGMIIADSLRAQHLGIGQAVRNANDGISMVQVADGALQESINIINTIKTKAIQAASDGQTSKTRNAIQNDIDKLMEELDVIAQTTSFNGHKLLSGVFTNKNIQIGPTANTTASISIASTESTKMGHITTADLNLVGDGGEVQLTITSGLTGDQLTLNAIDIQSNNKSENGMGALADEINRYTSVTGISATAEVTTTTQAAIAAGSTGSNFAINGITIGAVTVLANDTNAALITAINSKSAEHGIKASLTEDGRLVLTSTDGRAISVTGDVSTVFATTASQMSTIGYVKLTQNGVSEFQINGIGAGATGADINIKDGSPYVTVQDSVVAASSTLIAGSKLAAGTVVGGDALIENTVQSSALDFEMEVGSSIAWGSDLAQGTTIGAQITVGGDADTSGGYNTVALNQDMLLTTGSRLSAGSVIGAGTVVTTSFQSAAGGTTYAVGDTLTSAVTLSTALTLQDDITLKYDTAAGDNSQIAVSSTISAGSTLGAGFDDVGMVYNNNNALSNPTAGSTSTVAYYIDADASLTAGTYTLAAGSLLASGTELNLVSGGGSTTWSGPTLVTTAGILEAGDTVSRNTLYTLAGAQKISENLSLHVSGGGNTIKSGSLLTAGFVMGTGSTITAGVVDQVLTLDDAVVSQQMVVKSGSNLETGSKMVAGSTLGADTYVMGGTLASGTAEALTTYQRTMLKAGSDIKSLAGDESIIAEGSTIGGSMTLDADETLTSDMTLKAGTVLASGTVFKAGTVINQDMNFTGITGAVAAGTKLSQDLTTSAAVTLTNDMVALEGSSIRQDSVLAINTSNTGSVGLENTMAYKLSDLNVLTQESAQRAISIADAALETLDGIRANLGSVQNQLTSTISNLSVTQTNIKASESIIRDVDFAEESMNYAKLQLLAQTSSYAMAQSNASSKNIMTLLQ